MTTEVLRSDRGAPVAGKALGITLWAFQILLALAFAMGGTFKTFVPIAELATKLGWPGDVPAALVRFIGISELLGAVGLVLPAATRSKPGLTPLAAAGLTMVMLLAAAFHLSRGEPQALLNSGTLGGLAAFVAWGRFRFAPTASRG